MKKILQGTALLFSLFFLPVATIASVSISETHTNVDCNGTSTGSIDITVTGGNTPYVYIWNDGTTITQDRTTLIAGTYSVTVTDNKSCSASISVTITAPTAVSVTEVHTNVLCNGGSTGSITIEPVLPPLHKLFTCVSVTLNTAGSRIVSERATVHPLASVKFPA